MGFIYKITNNINQKNYVGKTDSDINYRWRQHLSDSKKDRCKNRPLYRAMNKYGIENFSIELIEETKDTINREMYWIKTLDTYKHGYNATIGGDGKSYVDDEQILELNAAGLSNSQIILKTGYDKATIAKYLRNNQRIKNKAVVKFSKKVFCVELGLTFDSQHSAARHIKPEADRDSLSGIAGKISLCCRGVRHSAYGYTWNYI